MFASHLGLAGLVLAGATASCAAPPTYRIVDRIAGPDGGWDYVRVDPAHDRLLVAHGVSVMAVDLATKAVTPGLAPGQRLHDALPVNKGAEVLVTYGGTDTADFIDAASGAVVATIHTGKNPDAATFDQASGLVLVMDHSGGEVTLVDPVAHSVVGTIPVRGKLEAAAVDGAGRAYVNVEDTNEIVVIEIAGRRVVTRYKLAGCEGPTGLAYDKADGLLIAACDGASAIVKAATGKVLQILPTGAGADGVAFDAAHGLAFVPAGEDGKLTVVAFSHGRARVVQTLATQVGARTIALDERTGRVYLPTAKFGPPAAAGGRPSMTPGSFEVIAVGL